MSVRRILVTGSRGWPKAYRRVITIALDNQLIQADRENQRLRLVHGNCRTGVDHFADEWGYINPEVSVERHPAEWDLHGKSAGFKRNTHMVSLGATRCLAFIFEKSHGATDCADKAEAAGIKVIRFRIDVT